MIAESSIVEIIQFFFGALALWLGWGFLHRDYLTDSFRQKLFSLRDELFDYADSGKIDFDHPGYGLLRMQINGAIRFAHHLRISWIIALVLVRNSERKAMVEVYLKKVQHAFDNIESKEVKEKLLDIRKRYDILVVKHIILGTPLLWLITLAAVIVVILKAVFEKTLRLRNIEDGVMERVPPGYVDLIRSEAYFVAEESTPVPEPA